MFMGCLNYPASVRVWKSVLRKYVKSQHAVSQGRLAIIRVTARVQYVCSNYSKQELWEIPID